VQSNEVLDFQKYQDFELCCKTLHDVVEVMCGEGTKVK
jgi:hypothetical protein